MHADFFLFFFSMILVASLNICVLHIKCSQSDMVYQMRGQINFVLLLVSKHCRVCNAGGIVT